MRACTNEEPGPDNFPYGYDYDVLPDHGALPSEFFERYNGAFSDDDTDIEYMFLPQMEKYGIEPTYVQLAEAWKYHVRSWVWAANREALRFMNYGHYPPLTGKKHQNRYWWRISSQLINEIWAVTAPGMTDYAVAKSEWGASILCDSIGVQPAMFYGAMYSAAFFEKDINRLLDIGIEAIGSKSYFSGVVREMRALHRQHPDDWKAARAALSKKYWVDWPEETKSIYHAILNGASSVLALLYGGGDFQRTLDIACALGFDADNQAASMSGLMGIILGVEGIPRELLYPVEIWEVPFNDRYANRSRHDMPGASIQEMAKKTAEMGEKIILAYGGERVTRDGVDYYRINTAAQFKKKLELHPAPVITFFVDKQGRYALNSSYDHTEVEWTLSEGVLPQGLQLQNGVLVGQPRDVGSYEIAVTARVDAQEARQPYTIHVLGANLSPKASEILVGTPSNAVGSVSECEESKPSDDLELLRDGETKPHFYSSYNPANNAPLKEYFGYRWDEEVTTSSIVYHTGFMEQHGGWFLSFDVEYLDSDSTWQPIPNVVVSPKQQLVDLPFSQAHYVPFLVRFEPVTTPAIRIIGEAAGRPSWNHADTVPFVNLSEVAVY